MKKTLLISIAVIFACRFAFAEPDKTVWAVQSMRIKPFNQAFEGFKKSCDHHIQQRILMNSKGEDVVAQVVANKPALILAIGRDALHWVKNIHDVAIVYVMVLNPGDLIGGQTNITGVDMVLSLSTQLQTIHTAFPPFRRWGIIYNPYNLGPFLRGAQDVAKRVGLQLIERKVSSPHEVPQALKKMAPQIDGFLMLPDISVIKAETLEYLFLFSDQANVPVVAFSEKYLELGAVMSIGINAYDMGVQAGEIASKIFTGQPIGQIKPEHARKADVVINATISDKLNITISPDIVRDARIKN